ncbi:hypothetical protein ACFXI8_09525 [Streptomyces niveus]|uniref:hypothetical protein n=1 Tax=Streptomyces niveus TaxID=193462 RepID=UPI003685FFCF
MSSDHVRSSESSSAEKATTVACTSGCRGGASKAAASSAGQRQMCGRQPYRLFPARHLHALVRGEHRAQLLGEPRGRGEACGARRRVHGDPRAVVTDMGQQHGKRVLRLVRPHERGQRGLCQHHVRGFGVPQGERAPVLRDRRGGPDRRGPVVERLRPVVGRPGGHGARRRLLARQPACGATEFGQRLTRTALEEAAVRRRPAEQHVQEIGPTLRQDPFHRGEYRRRRFQLQNPGHPLVPARRRLQPVPHGRRERAVVAVSEGLFEQPLEHRHPVGPPAERTGQREQQLIVALVHRRVQPRAQRVEHLMLLAAPQHTVERAEIPHPDIRRDTLQRAQRPGDQGLFAVRSVLTQQGDGQAPDRLPRAVGDVPRLQGVLEDPVQLRRGVGREQIGAHILERAEGGAAHRILFVAQPRQFGQHLPHARAVTRARGVEDQQRPGTRTVTGVRAAGPREQFGPRLGDRTVRDQLQDLVPGPTRLAPPGRPPAGLGPAALTRQQAEHRQHVVGVLALHTGRRQVQEIAPAVRWQRPQQHGEVRAADPVAAERGQRRRVGPRDPPQDGRRRKRRVRLPDAVRRDQQPYGALRVDGHELVQPQDQRRGQHIGPVPLQHRQHPLGAGGYGRGHPFRVPVPGGVAFGARPVREVTLGVVEHLVGEVEADPGPGVDRVGEFGQGRRHELRRADGQQLGRRVIAPLLAQPRHQALGQRRTPARQHDLAQPLPCVGRGVLVRRLDRRVRQRQRAGGPHRVRPDHRVPVGQPLRQETDVPPDERGERREPSLVGTAPCQLGHQGR